MGIYIDTCVLPRAQLQTARIYRERFGSRLGFELLMMFDLAEFEQNLAENLELFREGPLMFHEPVWGVEHTARRGSAAWEEGMYHLWLTKKYAEILHPASMAYHLNNCAVPPEERDRALRVSLENLREMREMFPDVELLVENTGTKADGTMLLNQGEFTDLCRAEKFPVLIDVGHAGANGWDVQRLIRELQGQIRGFHLHNNDGMHDLHNRLTDGVLDYGELIPCMDQLIPEAPRVIEYSRPTYHGEPLFQDIETLEKLSAGYASRQTSEEAEQDAGPELSAEQMNYILRSMKEAVCLTNPDGEVTYTNRAAEKLFGIRRGSRQKIWEVIPFEPGNDALIQLFIDGVMEKKESQRSMVDYQNRDGDLFHLYVNLTYDPNEAGVFVIVINDLTQLINAHSAFARYTSPEIANYVLTAPDGQKQGGQEREVSILMSDLRGFTAMSAHMDSTDLITLLNHYFESMSAVIRRYGGTVIEFLGDGIFTVFGAPTEMRDHASSAVSCAVDMQNTMAEVNAWNREHGYPELAMGIGINSGMCVVGNIGSGNRMKYGCMGETVNLAGRLESFSIEGQIHISEETRRRIGSGLTILNENSFTPKGESSEMKFYSISAIGVKRLERNAGEGIEWNRLPAAQEVVFRKLAGKVVEETQYPGKLVMISADGKFAVLETKTRLDSLQDLMIPEDGKLSYAKVLGRENEGYRIGYTIRQ